MKKFFSFFIGLMFFGMSACVNESYENCPTVDEGGVVPVRFASGSAMTRTSNAGNDWVQGDTIGIYMMLHGGNISAKIADNRSYKASGNGPVKINFDAAPSSQTMYYPSGSVDFIAYYPFRPNGTGAGAVNTGFLYPIDVSNQEDTAHIDVLYSNNATDNTVANNPVELQFNHVLSRIVIQVLGENSVTIDGTSAKIVGMPVTQTLKLEDGTLDPATLGEKTFFNIIGIDTGLILKSAGNPDVDYDTTYQAIVIPHTLSADPSEDVIQFVTGNGKMFSWKITGTSSKTITALEGGKSYTFWLNLTGEQVVLVQGTINDWVYEDFNEGQDVPHQGGAIAKYPLANKKDTIPVVYIPSGSGTIGDDSPNATRHTIGFSNGFYMSQAPITAKQYARFLNDIKATFTNPNILAPAATVNVPGFTTGNVTLGASIVPSNILVYSNPNWSATPGKENYPMYNISWAGAMAYAIWAGGKLPTEIQWEYAARGAIDDPAKEWIDVDPPYLGDGTNMNKYAYYGQGPADYPDENGGGNRKANTWNLIDMFGNVEEWLLDKVDPSQDYKSTPTLDPPADDRGTNHGRRGGSCRTTDVNLLKISARAAADAGDQATSGSYGFRLVFDLK
jgi:formylglycine-generating enzyme required for sulfatase activity